MANYRTTRSNLAEVLVRFSSWVLSEPKESQELIVKDLNKLLDSYRDEDAFGTEGQLDPRGDQRD